MSIEQVRNYLAKFGREQDILEMEQSTATVALAAEALGTIPARIAKTIAVQGEETCIVVVTAGDARLDNKKFKAQYGKKPRMLSPEETQLQTGHAVGGVCPFALPEGLRVALDESLKRFDTVFPACGSGNSAIRLTMEELESLVPHPYWVDVTKDWDPDLT